jgi:hypothetical protein
MMALTPGEIDQFRVSLAAFPQALEALQEIEDCDGDFEDAAISLALKAGQEPESNEQWLESFSKRYRHIACQPQFRAAIAAGQLNALIQILTAETDCPALLATPVALYSFKSGIADYCHSFDNSRVGN